LAKRSEKRFNVQFGEAPVQPVAIPVPRNDAELLERAMALLQELREADFMPDEFHDEYRALVKSWRR